MLHQKLDVREQFQRVLNQLACAVEPKLGATSDSHVSREFHQVKNLVLHLGLQ